MIQIKSFELWPQKSECQSNRFLKKTRKQSLKKKQIYLEGLKSSVDAKVEPHNQQEAKTINLKLQLLSGGSFTLGKQFMKEVPKAKQIALIKYERPQQIETIFRRYTILYRRQVNGLNQLIALVGSNDIHQIFEKQQLSCLNEIQIVRLTKFLRFSNIGFNKNISKSFHMKFNYHIMFAGDNNNRIYLKVEKICQSLYLYERLKVKYADDIQFVPQTQQNWIRL